MKPTEYVHDPYVCTDCGDVVAHTMDRDDAQPIRYECQCKVSSPGSLFPESWTVEDGEDR